MSDIPLEITATILCRLPVKSLLRFRCVCYPWRSLIDSQDFIALHLRKSAETNSYRTLVVETDDELLYVDLDSLQRLDTGDVRFKRGFVNGSCNGLILLELNPQSILLWNPSTRKQNPLPPACPEDSFAPLVRYALGYDSKHHDYKVVRVNQSTAEQDVFVSFTRVYSLTTNSWKLVADFPYALPGNDAWGFYLNDTLHTVISNCLILAFDLAREEFFELPTPDNHGFSHGLVSVEVLGGCLAAVVVTEMSRSEIWVMKEYGVKESWSRLISFEMCVTGHTMYMFPLAYSKSGDEILFNNNGSCFVWYNLGSKTVRVADLEGLGDPSNRNSCGPLFDARVCVESLVSPYDSGLQWIWEMERQRKRKAIRSRR
ncbi:F-box and associated interaction domains-containing protein [Striga asiatica]|uniref:F-box and associated interaction domains-containing protein n=1 Tax=Striga asiatica TaxID=4170 RepID=A0A5A7R8K3_STRAF|nr:F-box and associated interaction domains-containing protein [Striga asiatica]